MTLATDTRPVTLSTETLLRAVLGTMLALSCVSFIEPSPYEFLFFLLIPVALLHGLVVTRTTLTLFLLLFAIVVSQVIALFPYLEHKVVGDGLTPSLYTVYTVYLYSSAVLFALVFSQRTGPRLALALKTYSFSCVFAGAWGILSYLNVGGLGDREPILGRVAGPFKDPNVLGSYCIMGALFLMQQAVIGRRWRLPAFVGMTIVLVGGVFFSFSRGSWGATVVGTIMLAASTWMTSADDPFIRRRLRQAFGGLVVLAGLGAGFVASNETLRETFTQRAQLTQEYDGGETGRFGNQKRSLNMLVERPFGFGPFRFPLYFQLQPHNSYIGAFADAGWIGGCAFLILVATSTLFALRLAFMRSPWLRQAQVVSPALIGFFLQALQIDIDHWRFVFLMLGAVWGMQSAAAAAKSAQPAGHVAARSLS